MGLLLRKMVLIMTSPIDYTINQKEIRIITAVMAPLVFL